MKKVKLYPTLVISFILSSFSVTSAAIEETITYGTPPSPFGIDASLKQVPSIDRGGSSNGGSNYTPPEARAAIAAGEKAAYEGRKAWCKANNFPAAHCADIKQQIEQCTSQIAAQVARACQTQAETIKRAGEDACNKGALSGAGAAAVGGLALTLTIAGAPVTVPTLAVISVVGGATLGTYSTTSCPTQVARNHEDNQKTCATFSQETAVAACNK